MPISFRCGGCNQLLGIATRKAGAVVTCPTCDGKTIVPRPREPAEKAKPKNDFSLLERVDVDKLLGAPKLGKMATPTPQGKPVPKPEPVGVPSSATMQQPDPNELRALTPSLMPEALPEIPRPDEDDDDGPLVLEELPSNVVLALTKGQLASLLVLAVLLLAGAFALGCWIGHG